MKKEINEQLENEILSLIKDENYIPMKLEEMFGLLCNSDPEKAQDFLTCIQNLEYKSDIFFSKKGKVLPIEHSDFIKGTYRANPRGFGFVTPDEEFLEKTKNEDVFIPPEQEKNAITSDRVLVSLKNCKKNSQNGKRFEGKVEKIIERTLKTLTGTLCSARRKKERFFVVPDDRKYSFDVSVEYPFETEANIGDKVEVEITEHPGRNTDITGKIIRNFGSAVSKDANYSSILHKHSIRTQFPECVILEADKRSKEPLSSENRLDLRDKLIFTIDGEDAKDLDDAISVEKTDSGYILGVHIADVSHYVREDSEVDKEAFIRGTSVYFADKVVPMLPTSLSNNSCSLNSNTDKYTMSAFVTVDFNGKITDCQIYESIINSKIRGVYSELNDFIEKKKESEFFDKYKILCPDTIENILSLYKILEDDSKARGCIELDSEESKIIVDKNGYPTDVTKRTRGTSERIIEQFMIAANRGVALYLSWQNMPCIYRVHENPSAEKIKSFSVFASNLGLDTKSLGKKTVRASSLQKVLDLAKDKQTSEVLSFVLLRCLAKAKYSENDIGHFGLALDKYSHFTSPIRRYPDLALHRIIKQVLHGEIDDTNIEKINSFAAMAAKESTDNEIRATQAEREIEDLYKAIFMSDKLGEEFDGVVSSVQTFGIFVKLENTCEGFVPIDELKGRWTYDERRMCLCSSSATVKLGDKLKVRVENTDLISRRVELSVLSFKGARK